jgi:ethanolamine permease
MPRALTIAVLSLFVVGLGVLITGPSGAGTDPLGTVQDPLYAALTSPSAFGRENWLTRIIGLGALVGLIATFFSIVYASSRQLFSLGRDGYLPMLVAATDRRQTPAAALYIVVGVGVVASFFPPEKLILPIVFLFNVTYLFALAAFVRLRRQHPELERPYRAVGGVLTAAVTALLSLVVLAACFVQEPRGLLYALVIYAVLIVQFVLVRRRGMLEPRERS